MNGLRQYGDVNLWPELNALLMLFHVSTRGSSTKKKGGNVPSVMNEITLLLHLHVPSLLLCLTPLKCIAGFVSEKGKRFYILEGRRRKERMR